MEGRKFESKSPINRVVGNISPDFKAEIKAHYDNVFENQSFVEGFEVKKTPEQIELFNLANELTDRLCARYKIPAASIPVDNIHIIEKSQWGRFLGSDTDDVEQGGHFAPHTQNIYVEDGAPPKLVRIMIHELIHFKFNLAIQVTNTDSPETLLYRAGLVVRSRDGGKRFFDPLNEAITEMLTAQLYKEASEHPLLKRYTQVSRMVKGNLAAKLGVVKTESGRDSDEVYYVEVPPEVVQGKVSVPAFLKRARTINVARFAYERERDLMMLFLKKIFDRNRDSFNSVEEVFELFAEAAATGEMLKLRIVDRTFGEGTLRKIAEFQNDTKSLQAFVEQL